jgi:hypothetical protein
MITSIKIYTGHIIVSRGIVLRNNGDVHKIICNDPYGNLAFDPGIKKEYRAGEVNLWKTKELYKEYKEEKLKTSSKKKLKNIEKMKLTDPAKANSAEKKYREWVKTEENNLKKAFEKWEDDFKKRKARGLDPFGIGNGAYYSADVYICEPKPPKKGAPKPPSFPLTSKRIISIRYDIKRQTLIDQCLVHCSVKPLKYDPQKFPS